MINDFLELIKKYNAILENKIKESNNYNKIKDLLSKLQSKEDISEEEINTFNEVISGIELDEFSKKRIPFIIFLLKNKKDLDETQNTLFNKVIDLVKNNDNSSELTILLDKNNKVIDSLSKDEPFDEFEDLIVVFNELESSNDIEFDLKTKLGIMREIISKNAKHVNVIETEKTHSDEVFVEKEIPEEERMNEDTVKAIFEKYGYPYDSLTDKNKKYLLRYATEQKMTEVLDALEKIGIHVRISLTNMREAFCKILVLSSSVVISEYTKLCNDNGIDFVDYALSQPSVLMPNIIRDIKTETDGDSFYGESLDGSYPSFNNFKENIKYLRENGYNLEEIVQNAKKALRINPNILKENLEVLRDIYHIDMTDGKGFSGAQNGEAIKWLDRYIESDFRGYEYAKLNHSNLTNSSERNLYEFKVALREGHSLLHEKSTHKLVKYNRDAQKTPVEVIEIYKLTDSELQTKLGLVVPEFTGNDMILNIYVNKHCFIRPSSAVLNNSFIKLLDQYYRNDILSKDFIYNLGTKENPTLISRQKVLRVCQILLDKGIKLGEKEIKYALSFNSYLNEKDIENINRFRYIKSDTVTGGKRLNG